MKKWIYIMAIIFIVIIAILIGSYLFKKDNNEGQQQKNSNLISNKNSFDFGQEIKQNTLLNEISVSTVEKEKVSPNSVLILKKQYEECAHNIKEYAKMPEEYVNLTKEELEEKQKDWEIETFSPNEVTLIKKVMGVCNQHYLLRQKDGIIAIYQIKDDNTEVLKEETGISTEYLTEVDRLRLEEGIRIYGEEELNSTLEDYE